MIDLSAEKARLEKELAKADADIKRVDAKLDNAKFVAHAPEEIVEEEKEKREAAVERKAKLQEALERLKLASRRRAPTTCHCEERSDAAIPIRYARMDCFASLAMTAR